MDSKLVKVFDSYTGALAVPFERRIAEESGEEQYPGLLDYLGKLEACMFLLHYDARLESLQAWCSARVITLFIGLAGYPAVVRKLPSELQAGQVSGAYCISE